MKTIILLTGIVSTLCGSVAMAAPQKPTLQQVYQQTAREIRVLHREIGVGAIVAQVESSLTKTINETVVEEAGVSTSDENSGGNSWDESYYESRRSRYPTYRFGSYSFRNTETRNREWDITKFIVQNETEVQNFPRTVRNHSIALHQQLLSYVAKSELKLIRMKELGVKNLAAAHAILRAGQVVPQAELQRTIAILSDLNFIGEQSITTCVKINYADRKSESDYTWANEWRRESGYEGDWDQDHSQANGGGTYSSDRYWRQIAHSEGYCSSSIERMSVSTDDSVFEINLSQLDELIARWVASIEVVRLSNPQTPLFPTFGSPYYK